ncbi:MAG: hypothetical protein ACRDLB_01875 [Actinomycetota bacterium]
MMRRGSKLFVWLSDLEDDLDDNGQTLVFVPSIMGAGILVSLGILVGDAFRRLMPGTGAARRSKSVRRRVLGLVTPLATTLDLDPPTMPVPRRRLRTRRFYAALFVVAVTLALYVAIGSTANYLRSYGPFSGVAWMEILAMASSILFLATGVVGLSIAIGYPSVPRWARSLIDRTPLGTREE